MISGYTIMIFLWVTFAVIFLVLFGNSFIYLVGHSRREKITYQNFNYRIKFFNVEINQIIQGVFALMGFGLAVFTMFTGLTTNAEFRPYFLPSFILLILVGLLYFVYPILKQLDEDMTEYYHNYSKVTTALNKKEEAEKSVENTVLYKTKIISMINDFERQIRTVEDPTKFKLKDSTVLIDQFVETQTKKINDYETEVLLRFQKTLDKYFEHRVPIAVSLPKTEIDFEAEFSGVRSEIFDKYTVIFNETLYTLIDTKKYNTSTLITQGLQILKDNEYSPTEDLIQLILISIDDIEGSPQGLIEYLLTKKIVELESLITYAINKKIFWVFKNNLFETQDQLSTISERLITEDAYSLSVAFISSYFTRLTEVLAFTEKIKDKNKTLQLFDNYKKVKDVDAIFYDESRVLENKLMSLKEFFKKKRVNDTLRRELSEISSVDRALKNEERINKLYGDVQNKYDTLKLNSTQSLLMYSGISNEDHLLDLKSASNLFTDLYNRLLMKDLVVASLLLYGLFIYRNNDLELHNEAIQALKDTKEYQDKLHNLNLDRGFKQKHTIGKEILHNILFKIEKERLSNIVVMLEKERLTLDKLATIS